MIIVNIKWIENENFSPYLLLDEHVHKSEKKKKALKPINKSIKKSLVPSLDKINDLLFEFNEEILPPKMNSLQVMYKAHSALGMKYLLALIDHSVPNGENKKYLQGLILDARPTKSKWADSSRIGQAELYDGLERVLVDISNFTPYSTPFAQRVSRKEVPDYYEIIKKPMDFGTMWKKLKSKLYNSKREFEYDLELVFNNCFEYNIDQESTLRKYIILLREKWTKLLPLVSDIVIQKRETGIGMETGAISSGIGTLNSNGGMIEDLASSLDSIEHERGGESSSSFLQSPKLDNDNLDEIQIQMADAGIHKSDRMGMNMRDGSMLMNEYKHDDSYFVSRRTFDGMADYKMACIKASYRPFAFYPELQFADCIMPDDKKFSVPTVGGLKSISNHQYRVPLIFVENINIQRIIAHSAEMKMKMRNQKKREMEMSRDFNSASSLFSISPLELNDFDYYRDIESFSKLHISKQQSRLSAAFLLHSGFASASSISLGSVCDLISFSMNRVCDRIKELMPISSIEALIVELVRDQSKKLSFHVKDYFLFKNNKLREAAGIISSFERTIMMENQDQDHERDQNQEQDQNMQDKSDNNKEEIEDEFNETMSIMNDDDATFTTTSNLDICGLQMEEDDEHHPAITTTTITLKRSSSPSTSKSSPNKEKSKRKRGQV